MTTRIRVNLDRDWRKKVSRMPGVREGAERLADAIADEARSRTRSDTGRARDSIQVVEDNGDVFVAGGTGDGWYLIFQELGGFGFRPPPMPLRRAASRFGRITK